MIKAVIFDIGNVLLGWDPKNLYRKVFNSEEEVDLFLKNICDAEWNISMDAGKPFAEGIREKQAQFPQYKDLIALYDTRWEEMLSGVFAEPARVLKDLKAKGMSVYALTNFSKEKFEVAYEKFEFFRLFDGIVVSAKEKLIKPNPAIFRLIAERYGLVPETTLFIDDNHKNIQTAKELGFQTILFQYPELLRPRLRLKGIDI